MSPGGPDIKGLLGQIARVCLRPRQAERKLVQGLVVPIHYVSEVFRIHMCAVQQGLP